MPPSSLYATTGNDLFRLDRRFDHEWTVSTLLKDAGAQCISIHPERPSTIFVGTFERGLLVSRDAGNTFSTANVASEKTRFMAVATSRANPSEILAGTEPSSVYRSIDSGHTWIDLSSLRDIPSQPTWSFPPRPWKSHVRWIAVHPDDQNVIYAGIELGGVMVSRDGGTTWEDRKPGLYHDCHSLATHQAAPDRVYLAAGGGVAWSQDAGVSWVKADEGLQHRYVWGLAVDAADPDLWYVSAASSASAAHRNQGDAGAGIYRKQGTQPWQMINGGTSGLPRELPSMPYALLAPRSTRGQIVAAFQNGELWSSDDSGHQWHQQYLSKPIPVIHALAEG